MDYHQHIFPVILAGGVGSRLWPLSRDGAPKQFIPLDHSGHSLFQQCATRIQPYAHDPLIISSESYRFLVAEQLKTMGIEAGDVMLEPVRRNTAPAIVCAALHIARQEPDALLLILPSDHVVEDDQAFHQAIYNAAQLAQQGYVVTFGVTPTSPDTGYGYIKRGALLGKGAYRVDTFTEKPDVKAAQAFVNSCDYYWNSGMFVFPVSLLLREAAHWMPDVLAYCEVALEQAVQEGGGMLLDRDSFSQCATISIDYALMEKTDKAAIVEAVFDWSDVGTFERLREILPKDSQKNVTVGDVEMLESSNNYVHSHGALTALVGVDDLIVVNTDDALLVANRNQAEHIKTLVSRLKAKETTNLEPITHQRPWGRFTTLFKAEGVQVKELYIHPQARMSLQKHAHRSEHWVVLSGTARVTRNNEIIDVRENESVFVPKECVHRIENAMKKPLIIMEVQSGSYLGEDDIIRYEDDYGRTKNAPALKHFSG